MMNYLLIRHGETEYNEQGKIQGHIDIPLSPEGRKQASVTAKLLMEHVEGNVYPLFIPAILKGQGTLRTFIDLLKSRGYDFPFITCPNSGKSTLESGREEPVRSFWRMSVR
jgi:bisphosphoglycerate-dependent phosphoglycerate mutase